MRIARTLLTALLFAGASVRAAHALCVYQGQLYAKTTLSEEFADSRWVVHVKVVAADDHWSDEDDSWTIYHLELLRAFKGDPPKSIAVFTYRNSGGFYLDKGVTHDLGGEYLLFLDPILNQQRPLAAKGATEVNYSCGQSKVWRKVTLPERRALDRLSQ